MDPALLKERELFKKRALATPVIEKKAKVPEKKKRENEDEASRKKAKLSSSTVSSSTPSINVANYKTMGPTSNNKFTILAKIVNYMKKRHLEGEDWPLALNEIIDETQQLDIGYKLKEWLEKGALLDNPKIEVTSDNKFMYKPPYNLKDKRALLKLLKNQDIKGRGGVLLDDIAESLPNCDKIIKNISNEIIIVDRPDKKKIIFFNDKTAQITIDEEFQKLWRSAAIDSLDDKNIEDYLEKQGINSMQDSGLKKPAPIQRKKRNNKRRIVKPRDNEHLADVLVAYDENK